MIAAALLLVAACLTGGTCGAGHLTPEHRQASAALAAAEIDRTAVDRAYAAASARPGAVASPGNRDAVEMLIAEVSVRLGVHPLDGDAQLAIGSYVEARVEMEARQRD